jgi:hypothetical protein
MKVTIREPFWSAWSKYNWPKPCWGLGIKKEQLFDAVKSGEKLEIHVDRIGQDFTADPQRLIDYCMKKKAKFIAGRRTILYVAPSFLLDKVVKDVPEPAPQAIQAPLF